MVWDCVKLTQSMQLVLVGVIDFDVSVSTSCIASMSPCDLGDAFGVVAQPAQGNLAALSLCRSMATQNIVMLRFCSTAACSAGAVELILSPICDGVHTRHHPGLSLCSHESKFTGRLAAVKQGREFG